MFGVYMEHMFQGQKGEKATEYTHFLAHKSFINFVYKS